MEARLLIVEDQILIAAELAEQLEQMGYRVVGTAMDAVEAFDLFLLHKPDLVLMDIQLNDDLDGIEVGRRMKQHRSVPLIFITGNSDDHHFDKATQVQPAAFLSKPVQRRDLKYAIELALPKHKRLRGVKGSEPVFTLAEDELGRTVNNLLYVRTQNKIVRLEMTDLLWVRADDYYCWAVTTKGQTLLTMPLKRFAGLLPPNCGFQRCHRSYIINLARVTEVGSNYVVIHDRKIPVARGRIKLLKAWFKARK